MDLNVFDRYVNLCGLLSINPSWKGLNEYYRHNKIRRKFIRRKTVYAGLKSYKYNRN